MKKCTLICGYKPILKKEYKDDLFGIDKGALFLAQNGNKDFVAIGDFDSVNEKEFDLIKNATNNIVKLNPIKDDTDLEHALNYLKDNKYTDVEIYGCLGGRADHNLLNLKLIYLSELNVVAYDENNKVFNLKKGRHKINKDDYKFLSLFTFEKCLLNLDNAKYPINTTTIDLYDNYTVSNEFINDYCNLDIIEGKLLVIQTSD